MASASILSRLPRLLYTPLNTMCHRCMMTYAALPSFPVLQLDNDPSMRYNSEDNKEIFQQKEETFRTALATAHAGAGEKATQRHLQQNKKMVEERVKELLDDGSPFLELSPLAGFMMEYGTVPRAGMITGIGRVSGKLCMVMSNDGAVKGGTTYPITIKKNLRAQEIALQNRLPCIYVVDSGGAFLPMQAEIFPDINGGGRVFYNEAIMSAAGIPQVAVVCGSCTAGGAYVPTMASEVVIVQGSGSIFLGGPPLVKAALGEIISAEDLGGATVHCKVSGCTDYFAEDEKSAFNTCRNIVATLNLQPNETKGRLPARPPLFDPEELPSLIPCDNQHLLDMYEVIARLVDGSAFHEFKQLYGRTLVTGFAHLNGYLVGVVGNQGEMTSDAASKGAHFVTLCNERQIPIVFLQNTSPDVANQDQEVLGDQLKCNARMMAAVSCSTVPKITVIVGNAFGPAHYLMGGKSVSPNFLFAWPNAVRCIDNPTSVISALNKGLAQTGLEAGKMHKQTMSAKYMYEDKLAMETTAVYASARLLDDGIIMPQNTRQVLSQCLDVVTAYTTPASTNYSVIRM